MMDSLYGDDGVPLPSREFNQPANTTNTFWLGFSLILILFTFFWKKRSSDILR
jgi:LPXTG-motif cell wall-anchored protein